MKAAFNIQLQGYTAANRDATVRLVNQATGAIIERRPFLDGSLLVRDVDPGLYELEVSHPNLLQPIERRSIRLFPQPTATYVPIRVPPDLFRDTPIRDIPDADLRPIQQTATAVRDQVRPIATKSSGEAIRAADWNTLAGAVTDLAGAVLELTQLVSPKGHDHPEIAEKIGEVQANLRRFSDTFGRSLLELQREVETDNFQRKVSDVLELGNASEETRKRVLDRVRELPELVQSETPVFTGKLTRTGATVLNAINEIAAAQGANAGQFLGNPQVQAITAIATKYSQTGTQTRAEAELQTYRATTTLGGTKFAQNSRNL